MRHLEKKGIITGCNRRHEWMLKLWWYYYSQTNTYPVTFMDFGMTKSAKLWCEKRGRLIPVELPAGIPSPKETIKPERRQEWEASYQDVWKARRGWFYKPFAFLKSPYEQTFWIDIDTFVIKPLTPLFEAELSTIALPKEVDRAQSAVKHPPGETIYATGVVGFPARHPLIEKWAQKTREWNHLFLGDQDILSHLIHEEKAPVSILPPYFNARPQDGLPPETFIVHFSNMAKKELFARIYQPRTLS